MRISIYLRLEALLILVLWGSSVISGRALTSASVVLTNSVKPVDTAPGTTGLRHPYLSNATLSAEQSAAPMKFEATLKMRKFAELQRRVARGENISDAELAEKYEPLASDYDAVKTWARSAGLTVTREDSHHMLLFLSSDVSHVSQALRVKFGRVAFNGKEYTSATTAPSVPASISTRLLGLNGLQPFLRRNKHIIQRAQAQPNALGGGSTYKPSQIAAAYNVKSLYTSNIVGTGQTIAIVIDTFPAASDLITFWQNTGINQSINNIQFIQAVAGTLPDPSGEETLDVEWSSAMAPGANVRVYAATDLADQDLDATYQQVLDDVTNHPELNIHQLSMSYGAGETSITSTQLNTDAQLFAELAAHGVTCFASSGDDGSTPSDSGGANGPLQVENPASDPSVTGVGGTSLVLNTSNAVTSETVWNNSSGITGGGVSIHFARPSWQTGTGVNTAAMRQVPDISCTADPVYGAYTYFQGQVQDVGGTSWSSPTCAAFCALINQARASNSLAPLGILGPHLYPQIGTTKLRDIVSGNNITSGSSGRYTATTGFDECTGVGVPLMQALTAALANTSTLVGLQDPVASETVFPGQSASFTVTASGTSPTYQWQRMPVGSSSWSNLANDSTYSGVTSATLTIGVATLAMSGDQFQCVVQIGSTTLTSSPSVLIVDRDLVVSSLAGRVGVTGLANGTGTAATFDYPSGIALDSSGNLFVADFSNNQIRKVTPAGVVSTPYGNVSGSAGAANGVGTSATFNQPNAIASDSSNNLYVADTGNNIIRKITGTVVSTLAGTTNNFSSPQGIAVDASGNVYVADTGNDTIRKITPGGVVTILAGQTGSAGSTDGNATTQALFDAPEAVAVDSSGNVYVADFGNSTIRKISSGTVTTVAGQAGQGGYADGLGTNALFNAPTGLAFDASGNLYITDSLVPSPTSGVAGNCVVRKLTPSGVVSTVAGNPGISGSTNGTGNAAEFDSVQAVACDPSGSIYLADTYNQTVRVATVSGSSALLSATVTLGSLAATYDGSPHAATATTNPSGLTVVVTYDGSSTAPTNVGSYTVVGTINDSNYGGSARGTLVITKAVATVALTNTTAAYDGSAHAVTATTTPSGLGVTLTYNGSTVAPTAVGSYTVIATISDQNYSGSTTGTLTITKSVATVTLGNLARTYTGTGLGATATTVPTGLPVTFTYNGAATLPVNAGSYTVVATVKSPNAAGSASGTLVISPAAATVTLGGLSRTYTGAAIAATATTVPAHIPVTFSYNGSPSAPVLVGDYAVVGTISSVDYTGSASGTLTIAAIAPNVGTQAATGVGATSATLNGLVNPKGSATTVVYQYGTTTAYGLTTAGQVLSPGTVAVSVPITIGSLASQTLYHYRIVATNGANLSKVGADLTFRTQAVPVFATSPATPLLSASGVKLGFSVNPGGLATTAYFQYGTTTAYGSTTASQSIGAGTTAVNVSAFLNGLNANTTYHYRLVSVSAAGTFYGPDETVTTLDFVTALVASKGEAAPDIATATYSAFGAPTVNQQDAAAFLGTLAGTGVTTTTNIGLFADDSTGTTHLIARTGIANGAPLVTGSGTFATLTAPVFNNNEDVAFAGTLKLVTGQVSAANATGIWSNSSGALALVARQGTQAPDCAAGVTFNVLYAVGLSDANVVVLATLNPNAALGVGTGTNVGIWEGTSASDLTLVLRYGDTIGGKKLSVLNIYSSQATVGGQTRSFASNTGDLVGGAVFTDATTGLLTVVGGTPALIATSGSTAPGTNGATYATFSSPVINTNDHTAFLGTLTLATGTITAANNTGIWADDSTGTRQLIARTGPIANTTGSILTLGDPVYNDNEAVAYLMTSKANSVSTTPVVTNLMSNSSGTLESVAHLGEQAPGCPAGATFSAFTGIVLPDQDGVIFSATLALNAAAGITAANNTGIWAIDGNGNLQLIVRTGDTPLPGKTVTALTFLPAAPAQFNQTRSFAQSNGDLIYGATFSDTTSALVNVVFP